MRLRAKTIFLLPVGGNKRTVYPGETVEADEEFAQEMISLGAATEVAQLAKIPARLASADTKSSENQSESGNASERAETPENSLSREKLEEMSFAQLKEVAKALGIENVGKIKSKAGLIEAILQDGEGILEDAPEEEPPALDALDVIEE